MPPCPQLMLYVSLNETSEQSAPTQPGHRWEERFSAVARGDGMRCVRPMTRHPQRRSPCQQGRRPQRSVDSHFCHIVKWGPLADAFCRNRGFTSVSHRKSPDSTRTHIAGIGHLDAITVTINWLYISRLSSLRLGEGTRMFYRSDSGRPIGASGPTRSSTLGSSQRMSALMAPDSHSR